MKETRNDLKTAGDVVRKEIMPSLGTAYDKAGPAVVLNLALMLADIWLESGFTAGEWRTIITVYEPESTS